jgi:hypothetical protein
MCSLVGNAGSPLALFRRALATGNLTIAQSAAHELPRLDLADALALTLLYRDQEPARYERALVRWHGRFCTEIRAVGPDDAALVLTGLRALGGPRPTAAALSLAAVFDALVEPELSALVHDWLSRRSAK